MTAPLIPESFGKKERPDRPERPEHPDTPGKDKRPDRPERPEQPDRGNQGARGARVAADYGEDQSSLGQFVDDFTDLDNVSVAYQVINNVTLNCMELNYTVGIGEDSDAFQISQSSDDCWYSSGGWSLVYGDFWAGDDNAGGFDLAGGFRFQTINIPNGATITAATLEVKAVGAGNGNPAFLGIYGEGVDDASTFSTKANFEGRNWVSKVDWDPGLWTPNAWEESPDISAILQVIVDRPGWASGQDMAFKIQDDQGIGFQFKIRRQGFSFDNAAGNAVKLNVEWSVVVEGYDETGYFTTENYLDQVTGSTLVLMTNTTIPVNTELTVEFSQDNATWINSTELTEGFQSIDLRTLNWDTSIFLRYNFTSDGSDTPRVYQSRLITTVGVIVEEVIESDFPWVAIAIILMCVAYLLFRSK